MLRRHNSVVNFYRIRLTRPSFLNSLSSNIAKMASILSAAILVSVAGCAAVESVESRPDAEVVKERAQARWDALVSGDLAKAYGYLSPVTRSTVKLEDYAGGIRKGFWKTAKVEKAECPSATLCEATVSIEYGFQGRITKTPFRESWLKDGSTWWYVQK
jgi:hypothetical protein